MRLINAEPLIDECDECMAIDHNKKAFVTWADAEEDFKQRLEDAKTIDAVPVVRCKDCVHRHWEQEPEHGRTVHYCDILDAQVDNNFFCGKGSET